MSIGAGEMRHAYLLTSRGAFSEPLMETGSAE